MSPNVECVLEFDTGLDDRFMRLVCYENAGRTGLIVVHADTPGQQPLPSNFRWPQDTLKTSAFTLEGEHLCQHDVGKGIIPGLWYCPVFPFDLDGDGLHELLYADGFAFRGKTTDLPGLVIDRHGEEVGRFEGRAAFCHKIPDLNCPGEQILTHDDSATVRVFGCPGGQDTEQAEARYAHPYYKSCSRLRAVGYNGSNHAGL